SIDVITSIEAKKDGKKIQEIKNYNPKIGEEISLEFFFTLPNGHSYGEGSILIYELPALLREASGSGTLYNGKQVKYATYEVADGRVEITFTEEIRVDGQDGSLGLETTGQFEISAHYSAIEGGTNLEQELILPGQ